MNSQRLAVIVPAEEWEALQKRLADVERQLGARLPTTDRAYLTPKDVAKRFGVGNDVVYAALESGRMRAEARPGKGHARVWRIQPDEARAWYETFVAKKGGG